MDRFQGSVIIGLLIAIWIILMFILVELRSMNLYAMSDTEEESNEDH